MGRHRARRSCPRRPEWRRRGLRGARRMRARADDRGRRHARARVRLPALRARLRGRGRGRGRARRAGAAGGRCARASRRWPTTLDALRARRPHLAGGRRRRGPGAAAGRAVRDARRGEPRGRRGCSSARPAGAGTTHPRAFWLGLAPPGGALRRRRRAPPAHGVTRRDGYVIDAWATPRGRGPAAVRRRRDGPRAALRARSCRRAAGAARRGRAAAGRSRARAPTTRGPTCASGCARPRRTTRSSSTRSRSPSPAACSSGCASRASSPSSSARARRSTPRPPTTATRGPRAWSIAAACAARARPWCASPTRSSRSPDAARAASRVGPWCAGTSATAGRASWRRTAVEVTWPDGFVLALCARSPAGVRAHIAEDGVWAPRFLEPRPCGVVEWIVETAAGSTIETAIVLGGGSVLVHGRPRP